MESSGLNEIEKNSEEKSTLSSSWWNNLIKTAKEKSATAIEIMNRDLAEFKSTMSADTTRLVTSLTSAASTTNNPVDDEGGTNATTTNDGGGTGILTSLSTLTNAIGLNTLISSIAGASGIDDDDQNVDVIKVTSSGVIVTTRATAGNVHERFKADLKNLQNDELTYLNQPSSNDFEQFENNFNAEEYKSTISDLLIENSSMRLIYSQLVPAQISNHQFWSRYFFKISQIEDDYKKRVQLLEKASKTTTETSSNKEEINDWEDDSSTTQSTPKFEASQEKNDQVEPNSEEKLKRIEENNSASTKPIEENDDWEKLSDVEQIDRSSKIAKKIEKQETDGQDANSSNLSEVEVARSCQKEADNDWENWDE